MCFRSQQKYRKCYMTFVRTMDHSHRAVTQFQVTAISDKSFFSDEIVSYCLGFNVVFIKQLEMFLNLR